MKKKLKRKKRAAVAGRGGGGRRPPLPCAGQPRRGAARPRSAGRGEPHRPPGACERQRRRWSQIGRSPPSFPPPSFAPRTLSRAVSMQRSGGGEQEQPLLWELGGPRCTSPWAAGRGWGLQGHPDTRGVGMLHLQQELWRGCGLGAHHCVGGELRGISGEEKGCSAWIFQAVGERWRPWAAPLCNPYLSLSLQPPHPLG